MAKIPEKTRRELRGLVEARFAELRATGEDYDELEVSRGVVEKNWAKFKRWGKALIVERVRDWFGELAREAFEELQGDIPGLEGRRVPGVILHAGEAGKRRRGLRGATLRELRSYLDILVVNAVGAARNVETVRSLVERCEALGCGEDEDVWPYLSDTPRLPLRPGPSPELSPEPPVP